MTTEDVNLKKKKKTGHKHELPCLKKAEQFTETAWHCSFSQMSPRGPEVCLQRLFSALD